MKDKTRVVFIVPVLCWLLIGNQALAHTSETPRWVLPVTGVTTVTTGAALVGALQVVGRNDDPLTGPLGFLIGAFGLGIAGAVVSEMNYESHRGIVAALAISSGVATVLGAWNWWSSKRQNQQTRNLFVAPFAFSGTGSESVGLLINLKF